MFTGVLNSGFGHSVRFIAIIEKLKQIQDIPSACIVPDCMHKFIKSNLSTRQCELFNLYQCNSLINKQNGNIKKILPPQDKSTVKKLSSSTVLLNDFIPKFNQLTNLFSKNLITSCLYHGDLFNNANDSSQVSSFKKLITNTASKHNIFFHINLEAPENIPDMKCEYIPIPIVTRQVTTPQTTVKKLLGLKEDEKFILIHAGSAVMENVYRDLHDFYSAVNNMSSDYRIVVASALENNHFSFHPRIIRAPLFSNGIDLVDASEIVISKPGMGILQDCIATSKPLLFLPGDFAERDLKIELLNKILLGNLPIIRKINTANLDAAVKKCINLEGLYTDGYAKIPRNGAEIIANAVNILLKSKKEHLEEAVLMIKKLSKFI